MTLSVNHDHVVPNKQVIQKITPNKNDQCILAILLLSFMYLAMLNLNVDIRSWSSLSAGGPGASSAIYACGVSLGLALPAGV